MSFMHSVSWLEKVCTRLKSVLDIQEASCINHDAHKGDIARCHSLYAKDDKSLTMVLMRGNMQEISAAQKILGLRLEISKTASSPMSNGVYHTLEYFELQSL